jgi:hypothetical protein
VVVSDFLPLHDLSVVKMLLCSCSSLSWSDVNLNTYSLRLGEEFLPMETLMTENQERRRSTVQ